MLASTSSSSSSSSSFCLRRCLSSASSSSLAGAWLRRPAALAASSRRRHRHTRAPLPNPGKPAITLLPRLARPSGVASLATTPFNAPRYRSSDATSETPADPEGAARGQEASEDRGATFTTAAPESSSIELTTDEAVDLDEEDPDWFVDNDLDNQGAESVFRDRTAPQYDEARIAADVALVAQAHPTPSALINGEAAAAFLRVGKAQNVEHLNVSEVCSWCTDIVIAKVHSARQLYSIGAALKKKIKSLTEKRESPRTQGLAEGEEWVLLDAGNTVINIFTPKAYYAYDLATLWKDRIAAAEKTSQAARAAVAREMSDTEDQALLPHHETTSS